VTRLGIALLLSLAGCIVVPRSTQNEGARGVVLQGSLDFAQAGETKRRDLLLRLGEPDETRDVGAACYDVYLVRTSRWSTHSFREFGGSAHRGDQDFLLLRYTSLGVLEKHVFTNVPFKDPDGALAPRWILSQLIEKWENGDLPPPPRVTSGKR